jgi:DNA-binding IclR family transcriptional regulator
MATGRAAQRGVQSIEIGLRLVAVLAASTRPLTLKQLAADSGMSASKAHRYLVSLVRGGLVTQHAESGLYDLGDLALTAGLTKLSRVDAYQVALEFLSELRRLTDETVMLAVWNGQAPVAVRWMEAERPVNVHVRLGTSLPVINSATGRAFVAHMPVGLVKPAIERELSLGVTPTLDGKKISRAAFDKLLAETRRRGIAQVRGDLTYGIDALSAPIFDHQNAVPFVMTVVGTAGAFNSELTGQVAKVLLQVTGRCTRAIGGRGKSDEATG